MVPLFLDSTSYLNVSAGAALGHTLPCWPITHPTWTPAGSLPACPDENFHEILAASQSQLLSKGPFLPPEPFTFQRRSGKCSVKMFCMGTSDGPVVKSLPSNGGECRFDPWLEN